ncbi:hypothetical protein FJR38_04700 [Anabaena sp. UHCC 0253]|uniref:hypothetical protein n=1 Tax=Anabaena sp. UHCC 0253 TaxID=2590019 RepID=UPI00144799F4|nr:hypothetical protein [Anabaena sp. UHCC 0253]MTJ52018.1 hypothetical protein [Anabaena sp. UHCC 0253]
MMNGFFEYKFYSIAEFEQALSGYKTIENSEGKGIFAYVLAETIEELQDIRYKVDQLLSQSKHKERIAVAIPNQPVRDICYDLWKLKILQNKTATDKQGSETAFQVKIKELQDKTTREIKEVITYCTYHCLDLYKLTTTDKQNPESIVSHLLQQLYPFVPPLGRCDKMALKNSTGNRIIGSLSKYLLDNNTSNFLNTSDQTLINQVFVNTWGLFKTASQKYSVQVPTYENVKKAWNTISQLTALGNKQRTSINIDRIWRELSNPPFGYNEYTFTMLFTAWISYHRTEVMLQGNFSIPKSKKEEVLIQEKPIKDWVKTNVFDKPKDFVRIWILGSSKTPKLIRIQSVNCPEIPTRVDYYQAQKLIEEIDKFINSADPDQVKIQEIKPQKQQLLDEIKKIDDRLKPIETLENLLDDVNIETLVNLYSSLQLPLSKPKTFNLANNSNASISSSTSDTIVVNPTPQHKQRHADALKTVPDKINDFVEKLGEKSASLKTVQEFADYQVELETAIEKITQVSLPEHLIERLNYYRQVATRKRDEIQHEFASKDCLDKIEIRYNSLSNNATQQDYIDAIHDIEKLTNNIIKPESRYQQIITEIKEKQNILEENIRIWEEKLRGINKPEAFKLSQEISNQQNRFTHPESSQQVKEILEKLNPIILESANQEKTDIENQIITLFTQLSPERQQDLYLKLKEYLSIQEDTNE